MWRTLCGEGWDSAAARVVCRQLGFADGVVLPHAHFGQTSGTIWFDGVACAGGEEDLGSCARTGWGSGGGR